MCVCVGSGGWGSGATTEGAGSAEKRGTENAGEGVYLKLHSCDGGSSTGRAVLLQEQKTQEKKKKKAKKGKRNCRSVKRRGKRRR